MPQYQLIALDLDGTLTNAQKQITPRTLDTLMRAQLAGVRLVLASGRPTYGIAPLADQLQIDRYGGYVLAINGGRMVRWSDRQVVFEQTLDPQLVPVLHDAALRNGFNILTYQGQAIAATSVTDRYVQHEAFINKMPVIDYSDDFLGRLEYPINKCLIVGDPEPLGRLEQQLQQQLEGRMSVYRSADFFLECVPLGIDKAASLQRLITELNIPQQAVMACGDGYNDLSMVEFAGLGVAMDNAAPQLKQVAQYITLSNEEDGVAVAVEKFILNC